MEVRFVYAVCMKLMDVAVFGVKIWVCCDAYDDGKGTGRVSGAMDGWKGGIAVGSMGR